MRASAPFAFALAGALLTSASFAVGAFGADRALVLPFAAGGSASAAADLSGARIATKQAAADRGFELPPPNEETAAADTVKDGVADTTGELRTAGEAAHAVWALSATVDPRADGSYHLELMACQVKTGRTESVAREIAPSRARQEIAEMLGLLLRADGIAGAALPWENRADTLPPTARSVPPNAPPPSSATASVPPEDAKPPFVYASGHPWALGPVVEGTDAVVRQSSARGSGAALFLGASAGFRVHPMVELRADVAAAVAGSAAVLVDVGARVPFVVAGRLYAGPEAAVGAFVRTGVQTGAFLARGALFAGYALTDRFQLEAFADVAGAFGGNATIVLLGGGARALFRF